MQIYTVNIYIQFLLEIDYKNNIKIKYSVK